MAFNIVFTHSGLFSLGHAAFFGLGAYGAGLILPSAYGTGEAIAHLKVESLVARHDLRGGARGNRGGRDRRAVSPATGDLLLDAHPGVRPASLLHRLSGLVPDRRTQRSARHTRLFDRLGRLRDFARRADQFLLLHARLRRALDLAMQRILKSPFGSTVRAVRDNENRRGLRAQRSRAETAGLRVSGLFSGWPARSTRFTCESCRWTCSIGRRPPTW